MDEEGKTSLLAFEAFSFLSYHNVKLSTGH